jgi:ABC-type glutathione transport system ATPase component
MRGLTVATASGKVLVDDLSLAAPAGGIIGVVGETGAGKTMTMRALLGLLPHGVSAKGSVTIGEGPAIQLDDIRALQARLGKEVSVVLQNSNAMLDPMLPVGKQLIEGVKRRGLMEPHAALDRALSLLDQMGFGDPAAVCRRYPHELSGGMAQRVVTAMALMSHPKVLVLDEPTSALDANIRVEVLRLFRRIAVDEGVAVFMVSHDLGLVSHFCEAVAVLYEGRIVESGPTSNVVHDPSHPYTKSLLACSATITSVPREPLRTGDQEPRDISTSAQEVIPCTPSTEGVLVVQSVSHSYHGVKVLDNISLQLEPGKTLAVVGESGAGKSTLARLIAGLELPQNGEVLLDGVAPRPRSGSPSPVQMVFQQPAEALNRYLCIGSSVAEALGRVPRAARRARVEELLGQVGIDPLRAGEKPRTFSGGQLQRIVLARALAAEPKLLLCDEPTSALDVRVQAQIVNLILGLQQTQGFSCIVVTHDLGVARVLADDVLVLRDGAVVEREGNEAFFGGPRHAYSQALLEATSEQMLSASPDPVRS